jgi:hypothetical protein
MPGVVEIAREWRKRLFGLTLMNAQTQPADR